MALVIDERIAGGRPAPRPARAPRRLSGRTSAWGVRLTSSTLLRMPALLTSLGL